MSADSPDGGTGRIPWFVKLAVKLALSRLPIAYSLWRRIGIFRHGYMSDVAYAQRVLQGHLTGTGTDLEGKVALELGPGDSVLSGVLAATLGAERCYLVDVGPFASRAPQLYAGAAERLRALGLPAPELTGTLTFDDVLDRSRTTYLTDGVESLRGLGEATIDFAWSQAVLEHVRRGEFAASMTELFRVLRPGAVSSHTVDLKDHLGASLNNLRFPDWIWESRWWAGAGFYTNRLSMSEMLAAMQQAGFAVTVTRVTKWDAPPLAGRALARQFRQRTDDELRVEGFDVVLRKPSAQSS